MESEELELVLLYEHVPTDLRGYLALDGIANASNRSRERLERLEGVREDLRNIVDYLSNIGVRVEMSLRRMGYDERKFQVKFWMGMDFTWDETGDEESLREYYWEQYCRLDRELKICESGLSSKKRRLSMLLVAEK